MDVATEAVIVVSVELHAGGLLVAEGARTHPAPDGQAAQLRCLLHDDVFFHRRKDAFLRIFLLRVLKITRTIDQLLPFSRLSG